MNELKELMASLEKTGYQKWMDDPDSQVSRMIREQETAQLLPECDTNPSVFYILPPGFSSLKL